MKEHLGSQTMLELYGCNTDLLNDVSFIENTMLAAARVAEATIVQQYFHQFSPYGISGTVVIAESHINIHTWPEHGYAAIDIFTCSDEMKTQEACEYLKETFKSSRSETMTHTRGSMSIIKKLRDSQTQHPHQ